MIENLLQGLAAMANVWSIGAALLGLVSGIVIGALPGLTATMTVAVLSPFTFFMAPLIGLPFLLGVYKGAIYSGSIPAILINTPGTAAAAATTLDGHVLAREGKARKALLVSLYSSVVGDMLATIVLIAVTAPLAAIAIMFTSPEFTILFLFALTMIAGVSGNSLTKGLIAAALGAWFGCIGLDPMSGMQRFTFGYAELTGGIALVPVLIGMFALSEIRCGRFLGCLQGRDEVADADRAALDRPRHLPRRPARVGSGDRLLAVLRVGATALETPREVRQGLAGRRAVR